MYKIRIGKRTIGRSSPCYIIAEAGSNHNGSIDQAKRLIDAAADAGADAVKFQVFRARTMYPNRHIAVKYLKNIGIEEGLYEIIKRFEVPYDWIERLYRYSSSRKIDFIATPFDLESVKALKPYVPFFKIASYESLYGDLIEAARSTGKPLVISTGACTESEVDKLVDTALRGYLDRTVLMHCVAKYPAPLGELDLGIIPHMRDKYGVTVGYSDHSSHPYIAAVGAVALGAKVIEKHYTLSRQLPGPDHAFALEPDELRAMVQAIRFAEKTIADNRGERVIRECERELYNYKRCLYYRRDMGKGHKLAAKDLVVLRNTGETDDYINPLERGDIIGKRLSRGVKANTIARRRDL